MNESEAVVTRVEGDSAVIEINGPASACGSCSTKSSCGKAQPGMQRYVVNNAGGMKVGDRVLVSVPDGAVLKAALLSYVMPLVFVIGGAMMGSAWNGDGLPAVAGAALGLITGIVVLRISNTWFANRRNSWLAVKLDRQHRIHFNKET